MCAQIVAKAKPQNFFFLTEIVLTKRKVHERVKRRWATWRKENGLPEERSGAGCLCNAKVAPMQLEKRTKVKRTSCKQATEWLPERKVGRRRVGKSDHTRHPLNHHTPLKLISYRMHTRSTQAELCKHLYEILGPQAGVQ